MGHVAREKQKLLNRIKRMRGQIEAIERAVEAIHDTLIDPAADPHDPRRLAAEELVAIVHTYLT